MGTFEERVDVINLEGRGGHSGAQEEPEVLEPFCAEVGGSDEELRGIEEGVWNIQNGVEQKDGGLEVVAQAFGK